jgi:ABC-2 type transport system permease protein
MSVLARYADVYWASFKSSLLQMMQYRMAWFLWLVGIIVEPTIYLIVWQTVAKEQGGIVAGFTAGGFAAYYITWTLVRQMNIALTPYEFEERVQRGTLSPMLLRPVHPFHLDLSSFFGWKVITIVMWVPLAALLTIAFHPTLNPEPWQIAAFVLSLLTGFIMRFVLLWALGMATFWITKVSALFEVYFGLELFLSGRLVPISLLPDWMQTASQYFPYRWSFGFTIELLIGKMTPAQALEGFGFQALWFVIGVIVCSALWKAGVKKYGAVGA